MKKLRFNLLLFIFLFALSCSEDPIPSPSGDCRVAKIIYEGDGERFEQSFKYNAEGLLIEYNIPNYEATEKICKAVLKYNDQQQLISITETRGGIVSYEIKYSYRTPFILEGVFKEYNFNDDGSILLYYNSKNQLDSSRWIYNDNDDPWRNDTSIVKLSYENRNLVSGVVTQDPCCGIYTFSEASYDSAINPEYLLTKATNNFGFINPFDRIPTSSAIASAHNILKNKWVWESRSFDHPDVRYVEQTNNHEYFYKYYENSSYPKERRNSLDGVPQPGKWTYIYEACK
jgi:hypothetical protein